MIEKFDETKNFFRKLFSKKKPPKYSVVKTPSIFTDFMNLEQRAYERQLDFYQTLRGHIEHEDELINQRLTWSLTAQGLLFIAYSAFLNSNLGTLLGHIFLFIIAFLGFALCMTLRLAVDAAIASLDRLNSSASERRKQDELCGVRMNFPPISGAGAIKDPKFGANVEIQGIAWIFGLAWVVLMVVPVCLNYFSP